MLLDNSETIRYTIVNVVRNALGNAPDAAAVEITANKGDA